MNKEALPPEDSLFSPAEYEAKRARRADRLNAALNVHTNCAELPPILEHEHQ
jgi:hypothetical protein